MTPGLAVLWWALRDSNPEPRDYESPALTVAPRALMYGEYNFNYGNPAQIASLHVVKYYHGRASRTTHDQVRYQTTNILSTSRLSCGTEVAMAFLKLKFIYE